MNAINTAFNLASDFLLSIGIDVTWYWFHIQAVIILAAAGIGAVVSRWARPRLITRDWMANWPEPLRRIVQSVIDDAGLAAFAITAASARGVMTLATWPSRSYVLGVAATLATAWVVIRMIVSQIRDRTAVRIVVTLAWLVAALVTLRLFDKTLVLLDAIAIPLGDHRITALLVLKSTLLLAVTLWAASVIANHIDRRVQNAIGLTPSAQALISNLVKPVLFTLTVVTVLNAIGVDLSALSLFSGALGVGLGFGLQKIVSNFVSGMILLADKSIKPGDVITVGESFGWVARIGMRFISVATRDGRTYLIPNEDLVTQRVINWSHTEDWVRLDVPFSVAYSSNPHDVRRLAVAAAGTVSRALKSPEPVCHLTKFADSGLEFVLRFWIRDPIDGITNVRGEAMLALWDAFRREGVEIPYPVQELRTAAPLRVVIMPDDRASGA